MKTFTVKLSLLDRKKSFYYDEVVAVEFKGNPRTIGSCKLFKGSDGRNYGLINLNIEANPEWFFYYTNKESSTGEYWFNGILFDSEPSEKFPTAQLKDMIYHG